MALPNMGYSEIVPFVQGSGLPDKASRAKMKMKGIKPKELKRHHRIACKKDLKKTKFENFFLIKAPRGRWCAIYDKTAVPSVPIPIKYRVVDCVC